jgi:hypothetical protein
VIDLLRAAQAVQRICMRRRWRFCFIGGIAVQRWGSLDLVTCSAEDLVVLKAFADRGKDWADIEGVLTRQRGKLGWRYIWAQLRPLVELKGEPEILERLKRLRRR